MRRCAVVTGLVAGGLIVAGAAPASAADRDCSDFKSQREAQQALEADPSDPERLDQDDNGIACETELGGGSRSGQEATQGGQELGDPGTGDRRITFRVQAKGTRDNCAQYAYGGEYGPPESEFSIRFLPSPAFFGRDDNTVHTATLRWPTGEPVVTRVEAFRAEPGKQRLIGEEDINAGILVVPARTFSMRTDVTVSATFDCDAAEARRNGKKDERKESKERAATKAPSGSPLETVSAVSCTTLTVPSGTYRYDRNDVFAFGAEGDEASFVEFREGLRKGSEVQIFEYSPDPKGVSAIAVVNVAGAFGAAPACDKDGKPTGKTGKPSKAGKPGGQDKHDEQVTTKPRGGVETGTEATSGIETPAILALGGLALLSAGGAAVAARRRP